jgi:iron(II)-dependent oxidoreductase
VPRQHPLAGFRREPQRTFALEVDAAAASPSGFAQSVVRGLSDHPRWLACRWLYDDAGSEIFEAICEQPEYYQTRTEAALLAAHAGDIRALVPGATLVELGSGSSTKTRHLLRAWTADGSAARYVPVDVSIDMLRRSCAALAEEHPDLEIRGVAATYERAFPLLREVSPLVLVFLGSTIGNLNPDETADFLDRVSASLAPGDHLLLGIDLVKDVRTLEAAYNDAAGWSAAFTRNLFARMNRELDTGLDLSAIEHVAYYNQRYDRIEIYARFTREQELRVPEVGRRFRLAAGEMILTEISRKFQADEVIANAARFGFESVRTFTDPARLFSVLLLRLRDRRPATAGRARQAVVELAEARTRTLELVDPLSDEQLARQHSPLMSPIVWDLGHIANYEDLWSRRAAGRDAPSNLPADPTRTTRDWLYDAVTHPRATRKALPLPDRTGALRYLAEVRAATQRRLRDVTFDPSDPLLADGYVYSLIAQHEAQHGETILQTTQLIADLRYEPVRRADPPVARVPLEAEWAVVPAGPFVMGTDDRAVAYDNERPAHPVDLPRYRIDLAPVTNAQYRAFVEDGGYARRALWTEAGWRWLEGVRGAHPAQWRRGGDGRWYELTFGRLIPLAPDRPVVHVSWYEADAYARWAGKRLPTEAEWEKAASWDATARIKTLWPFGNEFDQGKLNSAESRNLDTTPVGQFAAELNNTVDMGGNVSEWTSSLSRPYPYNETDGREDLQAEGDRIYRGGSWAQTQGKAFNVFRLGTAPNYSGPEIGFRCAVTP